MRVPRRGGLKEALQRCIDALPNNDSPRQESNNMQASFESAFLEVMVLFHAAPDFSEFISATNEYGQTLAHLSILSGFTTLLENLVEWGIDLTIADVNGFTALHCAYLMDSENRRRLLDRYHYHPMLFDSIEAPSNALDKMGRVPEDLDYDPTVFGSIPFEILEEIETHSPGFLLALSQ